MRIDISYIRFALLTMLFCLVAEPLFSQEVGTKPIPFKVYENSSTPRLDLKVETGLDYRYQERDWAMPRYGKDVSFGSKFYLNAGYGLDYNWKDLTNSRDGISKFGLGYNFSPVHSMEFNGNFADNYKSVTATYYMNLNNAALRSDANSRFDIFLGAGIDTKFESENIAMGFATALRGRYNLTRNLGIYVEPRATFGASLRGTQEVTYVATSVSVGVSYKFGAPEFYIMDYIPPKALRNPKRLNVPYEFDVLPFFAFKSNLLFDAATAINISVEVPIGQRWSISAEWMFPWWLSDDKSTAIQLLSSNIEGRYWLGERRGKMKMTGFFAGYYVGGGLYDLRLDSKGYQGEFYIASGLCGGYAHALNQSGTLRMEYSLSIGYLSTDYRYYEGRADNRFMVWQYNGHYSWFGPTKGAVSFVWMLNINKKRKGGSVW